MPLSSIEYISFDCYGTSTNFQIGKLKSLNGKVKLWLSAVCTNRWLWKSHDIRNEAQKEGLTKMVEKFKETKETYLPINSG